MPRLCRARLVRVRRFTSICVQLTNGTAFSCLCVVCAGLKHTDPFVPDVGLLKSRLLAMSVDTTRWSPFPTECRGTSERLGDSADMDSDSGVTDMSESHTAPILQVDRELRARRWELVTSACILVPSIGAGFLVMGAGWRDACAFCASLAATMLYTAAYDPLSPLITDDDTDTVPDTDDSAAVKVI